MALVFSYCRFSCARQVGNDSIRRQQAMATAWLARHPDHTLDENLRLKDLAVSAYWGHNLHKDKGALGAFIQLAREGEIPSGSILMLERLDRFSRLPTRLAYPVLCELVKAGVKVLTLEPEQLIDETNIDDMQVVLPVILSLQLAYDESKKKADRIKEDWAERRRNTLKEGKPLTSLCPTWLYWEKKTGRFRVKPDGRKALLYIFKRTCEGLGQGSIAKEIQKRYKPLGRGKVWYASTIGYILKNRQVLGEFQPYKLNGEGQRIPDPDSPAIEHYYPQVIAPDLFNRANGVLLSHCNHKGRSSQLVNLFTGLLWGKDGYAYHIIHNTAKRKNKEGYTQRRLTSLGHIVGKPDACPLSVNYWEVERLVLHCLREIKPSELNGKAGKDGATLNAKLEELQGVEKRIEELGELLADTSKPLPSQVGKALLELERKREQLKQDIERWKQEKAMIDAKPLEQAQGMLGGRERDIFEVLTEGTAAEQHNRRLKLRGLIACLVERIVIEPVKQGRRVGVHLTIMMRGGGFATAYRHYQGENLWGIGWDSVVWEEKPSKGRVRKATPAR